MGRICASARNVSNSPCEATIPTALLGSRGIYRSGLGSGDDGEGVSETAVLSVVRGPGKRQHIGSRCCAVADMDDIARKARPGDIDSSDSQNSRSAQLPSSVVSARVASAP